MEDMQAGINAILSNPQMMEQIMSMAQSLGGSAPPETPAPAPITQTPEFDLSMIQKLSGLAGQTGIDQNQKMLLSALSPYLSCYRIDKLEKAMRAAKMARLASEFLGNGALSSILGR